MKKLEVNDYGFVHLILILFLHYLVKCRSRSLSGYKKSSYCMGSACIGSVTVSRRCLLQTTNSWLTV